MRRIVNLVGRELGLEGDARPVFVGQSVQGSRTAGQEVSGVYMNRRTVGENPKASPGNGFRQCDGRDIHGRIGEAEGVVNSAGTAGIAIVIV